MPDTARDALNCLLALADPAKAAFLQRYFKTGPGEYGHGDLFLGLTVPQVRVLARQFRTLGLDQCLVLLHSPYNEARLLALLILVYQYQRGNAARREEVFALYLRERRWVNNWNLVDSSAPAILGGHLLHGRRSVLMGLADGPQLWDRRMAVVATFTFIRAGDFSDTLALCERLLDDRHDLMHKACGWMLREVGKRDEPVLRDFLDLYAHAMPRTMLRYAIEKLDPELRLHYLSL